MADAFETNARSPLFVKLSGELRNHIYRFCLVQEHMVSLSINDGMHRVVQEPSILKACRQVRLEALSIYYSENIFSCTIHWNLGRTRLEDWFQAIGPSRASLIKSFIQIKRVSDECSPPSIRLRNLKRRVEQISVEKACRLELVPHLHRLAASGLDLDVLETLSPSSVATTSDLEQVFHGHLIKQAISVMRGEPLADTVAFLGEINVQ
ncbi:hypothetical protein PRZ48_013868 [Zasmidium cellare]|uniref:2EXR domain-containing protein n=1 Tax=Zasmidium cellare TaxID=395010 RepID=A0ABR0E2V0_ZASCE|nr:hypothetical protein PRZ48_013868 [Zasmidium cellare]